VGVEFGTECHFLAVRSYILPAMEKPPPSLRTQKKEATRRALLEAANRRFHAEGFDATTIEDVCQDVGVGRRTFFRYFADKESLAFPHRDERLARFVELLGNAPSHESPIRSLRRIAHLFAKEYQLHRESLLAQQRLIQTTPALLARENEIDRDWEVAMAQLFRKRSTDDEGSELHSTVMAGAAIGVIRATMRHWFATNACVDLAQLGDEALDRLERGFVSKRTDVR
jgi:AcrR family transcriptional regulator